MPRKVASAAVILGALWLLYLSSVYVYNNGGFTPRHHADESGSCGDNPWCNFVP